MGLFQHKKESPIDEHNDGLQDYFDEYFLELRNRGRIYFEKMIYQNAALFKQDLDSTVSRVNTELKDYMIKQLDEQFAEFNKSMQDTQEVALQSLKRSATSLEDQQQKLNETIQKSLTDQETTLAHVFDGSNERVASLKDAQDSAIETLNKSVKALQEQHEQLAESLQKDVAEQKEMILGVFEQNMAQIIEHYMLGALGDQYDVKAQLPAIIKQMEENKKAISDDMKL